MKSEIVNTDFQDESVLKKQPQVIFRLKVNGGRVYYTVNNGEVKFYISLTTLTKNTLPTSPHLIKWMCSMGYEESQRYMNERADYGTLLHKAFGEYVIRKSWNTFFAKEFIENHLRSGVVRNCPDIDKWADDLNDDVAAFAQFVFDNKVKPLAIELVLVSKEGYGTLIDLVCRMTIQQKGFWGDTYSTGGKNNPKGSPKESVKDVDITALLNFKSGRKGFYEEHEVQLELEKKLFEENYPDIKIDRIFNFSPKEWQKMPTYNLVDQTDSLNIEKAEHLLAIAKIELMKRLPNERIFETEIKYGELPVIKERSIEDIIREQHEEKPLFVEEELS